MPPPLRRGFSLILTSLSFSSSIIVKLLGGEYQIVSVKRLILVGVIALIPLMMILDSSGRFRPGRRRGAIVRAKQQWMIVIAATRLLVLTPAR